MAGAGRTGGAERRARGRAPAILLVAALIVSPTFLGNFWLFVLALAVVYALLSLSLVVLTGWSGQLNLHVAALGLGWGSYSGFALVAYGVPPAWALAVAGVVAIPFAIVVALVAVRFRGLELAVATLAIGLIFERLVFRNLAKALAENSPEITTPFASSFVSMPRPTLGTVRFDTDAAFLYFCLALAVVLFWVVGNIGRSQTGRSLRAIQERELMAETLGIPVIAYRIGAFVGSIVVAATAGALFASFKQGIAPDSFNLDLSFQVLAATVIGGIRSPAGAVIGGGLTALLPELVRFGPLQVFGGERLFVLFGVGMILVLWRLPDGIAGSWGARRAAREPGPVGVDDIALARIAEPSSGNGELAAADVSRRLYTSALDRHARPPLLRVEDVRVRFGGVVALDGVRLFVPEGEICALIGPNGAGKSTLFNCVSGVVTPESGQIYLEGRDVTELPAHRRAALGIGRTFQTVEVFRQLSVLENLMVAGHLIRRAGPVSEAFSLPAAHRSERLLHDRARGVLATLGLEPVADRRPDELPLGLLRVLEAGMALVARPRLLLLDEPSAGLDAAETDALARLVSRVRSAYGVGVLLVEHDMSMVATLAEHVYVLDFGTIISQGVPEVVRTDPIVLEKYLGADWTSAAGPGRRRAPR